MSSAQTFPKLFPNIGNKWNCTQLAQRYVYPSSNSSNSSQQASPVIYTRLNCSAGVTEFGNVGPGLVFNIIAADLSHPRIHLRSEVKNSAPFQLAKTSEIARAATTNKTEALSCTNGGYFYRLDIKHFFDDVCIGKNASDAALPVNPRYPIRGAGDGWSTRQGVLQALTCSPMLYGFNLPATFVLDKDIKSKKYPYIVLFNNTPGKTNTNLIVPGVMDAITAGPLMVADGKFAVPNKDQNLNRLERSANTCASFRKSDSRFFQVTIDGRDGCPLTDPSCGLMVNPFSSFMRDFVGVDEAMNLDQGGSTTMWVKDVGTVTNPGSGERDVFNALCVEFIQ